MNVAVAFEKHFKAYQGVDMIPWAEANTDEEVEPAAPRAYRLLKTMTIQEFTQFIAEQQGIAPELLRPWVMVNRQNGTIRPDNPLTWPNLPLTEAADKFSTRSGGFRIFMEEAERGEDGKGFWPNDTPDIPSSPAVNGAPQIQHKKPILIFLKHFDVDKQVLQGVGHVYMNPMDKVQDLAPHILQLMGWDAGVMLELYEEIKQTYIERMKPKNTLVASEIQDGDIVCFQRHLSDTEQAALKQTNPTACMDAIAFYDYLVNRIQVTFTPKVWPAQTFQIRREGDERFCIPLSKKDSYDAMAHKVAEHLSSVSENRVDPSHLRFTTVNSQNGKPRSVVKRQQNQLVQNILLGANAYAGYQNYQQNLPDHLFYEVLEMSLTDLEQRKNVRVIWLTEDITKEEPYDLLVHKQSQFNEVLATLQKRANLPDEIMDQIRFYEAHSYKVYKIIPPNQSVIAINEFMQIFAERIPEEEETLDIEKGDRLLYCFHFDKEPAKSHGVPFIFAMKNGEVFKETKERLSKRTGIKGKNLEKIRFAVIKGGQTYSRPIWIEDGESYSAMSRNRNDLLTLNADDILSEKLTGPDDHLGLEHPNRTRNNWVKYESLNIR
jgi:ubiquitin carboxyl-terminal hydrolase 7